MNRIALLGLSSALALGACAQPETETRATGTDTVEAEATLRTVQIKVTGMR